MVEITKFTVANILALIGWMSLLFGFIGLCEDEEGSAGILLFSNIMLTLSLLIYMNVM